MKNSKRIITGIIASLVLLPGVSGKASLKGMNDNVITTKKISVYDGDTLDSHIIGNLNINESLIRIFMGNNLDLICYKNHLGYVEKNSIISVDFPTSDILYKEISDICYTIKEVNLRSGPNTTYPVIKLIASGEVTSSMAVTNNGWVLVNYQGTIGFISKDYLKKINFAELEDQLANLPKIKKMVVAKKDVNIRREPSINSSTWGVLKAKKKVSSMGPYDSEWYQVTNGKNVGYISKKYSEEKYVIDGMYYKRIYMTLDAKVYNTPYGKEIGICPKYEVGLVYGETRDYYLIEVEGKVGFVKKCNVKELTGKYIIVDISSQKLYLYDNLDLILTSSIVSGKDLTPTDLGIHKIYSKELNKTLIGPGYESFVKYWMPFNGGEGLHDASWRHKFGGSIYKENGSHGCVNLPTKVASEIYNNVSVGNKVLVKH